MIDTTTVTKFSHSIICDVFIVTAVQILYHKKTPNNALQVNNAQLAFRDS